MDQDRLKEIESFAREQLAKYPPVEYVPDWHPYFWLGALEAVERMREAK
jgi:hypothetical protein